MRKRCKNWTLIETTVIHTVREITITWMSGSVGATFIKTSLLASNIPVRRAWLQCQVNASAQRTRIWLTEGGRRNNDNLENCPRIAGIEPLYNPWTPICGSFEMISGKLSVDACTRVWQTQKYNHFKIGSYAKNISNHRKLISTSTWGLVLKK